MINTQLINPKSIVVIGASNDVRKAGGKLLKNIIDHSFSGALYCVNPKADVVQGVVTFASETMLPVGIDLAILAIPASFCLGAVKTLALQKGVKAFVIVSAGFGELSEAGKVIEQEMVAVVNSVGGCLVGPNCIGIMNANHASVFTLPVPSFSSEGIDFISGSGAAAVFTIEAGMARGFRFNNVFSVGNSCQIGVEEVLEYLDEHFEEAGGSKVKLLYVESIGCPEKFLKHARSLTVKGCRLAAIKAGCTTEGSRAACSHTGALVNSDVAVDALFAKAGIIRCSGREELATIGAVLLNDLPRSDQMAIITHAGGSAVMLTDVLSAGGIQVPMFAGRKAESLKAQLFQGASVANPIDFLATGTAAQLAVIIDACENDFKEVAGMVVIFGSPGLSPVDEVYQVLHQKINNCSKPIFAVLPSVENAKDEIARFVAKGNVCFADEVVLGKALVKVMRHHFTVDNQVSQRVEPSLVLAVKQQLAGEKEGFLSPTRVVELIDRLGIEFVMQAEVCRKVDLMAAVQEMGFPLAMKVAGPLHKTDVGGVVLNIVDLEQAQEVWEGLISKQGVKAVLLQPMVEGLEFFIGAKYEAGFGHLVMVGLGGVTMEVFHDVQVGLAPLSLQEVRRLIKRLKCYKLLTGFRGGEAIDLAFLEEMVVNFSLLVSHFPELKEIDINPLKIKGRRMVAVDARIRKGG